MDFITVKEDIVIDGNVIKRGEKIALVNISNFDHDESIDAVIAENYHPAQDNVNHPNHYTSSEASCCNCNRQIECIDVTRHMSFNIGNAVKYLWRYKFKNGVEDLQKAIWYINDEINKDKI